MYRYMERIYIYFFLIWKVTKINYIGHSVHLLIGADNSFLCILYVVHVHNSLDVCFKNQFDIIDYLSIISKEQVVRHWYKFCKFKSYNISS